MPKKTKRTRWVRKGQPKSKGWKKTGRTRKKKSFVMKGNKCIEYANKRGWTQIAHPPKYSKRPFADMYFTTIFQEFIGTIAAGGIGTNANGNYGTFTMNSFYRPIGTVPDNTNAQLITTAGGAGNGLAITAVTPFSVNDNAPWLSSTIADIWQRYLIYDQTVNLRIDQNNIGDSLEACLVPLPDNYVISTTAFAKYAPEMYGSKTMICSSYADSFRGNNEITLPHVRLADLTGRPNATIEELIADRASYSGVTSVGASPTTNVGYLLTMRTLDGAATTGVINIRIRITSRCVFYVPQSIEV